MLCAPACSSEVITIRFVFAGISELENCNRLVIGEQNLIRSDKLTMRSLYRKITRKYEEYGSPTIIPVLEH